MLFFLGISFLAGCSSGILEEKTTCDDFEYGSISVSMSDARALDVAEIETAKITVYGSDFKENPITSTVNIFDGKGNLSVEKIPVGKNRIVKVEALDSESKLISGYVLTNVVDVKVGKNFVTVNWETTGIGNVYLKLYESGKNIADYTDEQNSSIYNAIPAVKGYFVNCSLIVSDFLAGTLKTGSSCDAYILGTAALAYKTENASGCSIKVCDPCSEEKIIGAEDSGVLEGIIPGTWKVVVKNGEKIITTKNVTFNSNETTDVGVIGDVIGGKTLIFVKASSAPKIWLWQATGGVTEGSELLGTTWNNRPTMVSATTDYMENPSGWYMFDLEGCNYTKGIAFNFKLNDADNIKTDKTSTFWYDGSKFYDSDPSANMPSEDATLSSISINGTPVDSFSKETTSYSLSVESSVENVTVSATATHAKATVNIIPSGAVAVAAGETASVKITVTAEDGTTTKTYNVSVRRAIENDTTLSKVLVNGKAASVNSDGNYSYKASGSSESFEITSISAVPNDGNAKVSYSESSGSVTESSPKTITITVTNGTKTSTYTLTVSYEVLVQNQYYWTNKNGAVGTNKTISSWSDWTEDERIGQCASYDDPRTWWGIHEVPYDAYALYAAYDDTNLYIMVELTNAVDRAKFMYYDYAASDNAWWDNRDIPLGLAINTGKAANPAKGPYMDTAGSSVIWGGATGGINFTDSEGMDYILYHSSKYGYADHKSAFVGVGKPGLFKVTDSGIFSYDDAYCLSVNTGTTKGTSGIDIKYKRNLQVSKEVWCENSPAAEDPINQNRESLLHQTGEDLMTSTNYIDLGTESELELDMSYWYTIPLSTLGIDKNYLETQGIGIRQLTTNGGSLMDCIPWDPCMVDVAAGECSDDPSTSAEKRDIDNITTPQARIGH